MVDIRNVFRRVAPADKVQEERAKVWEISPSERGLYVGVDGGVVTPYFDVIEKRDFRWGGDCCSIVVSGLMEWYERYLQHVTDPEGEFDWRGWHRDGLMFTKRIFMNLPRCVSVRYVVPSEDGSGVLESFDVTEERLDSLLAGLGESMPERDPVICDSIAVGVKEEDGCIHIRLKVKGRYECYTFQMQTGNLQLFRGFLEKMALTEVETVSWESRESENGMYFYPQQIGGLKHMGRFNVFSDHELVFSAYINSREFIRSVYRSIMTHVDVQVNRSFQSNILECYIDDERCETISYFRTNPKLANILGPAIDNVKKYLQDIYRSILEE